MAPNQTFDRIASGTVGLLAPVVLGSAMTLVAESFRPGSLKPLDTAWDRFFVYTWALGTAVAMIGLFMLPFGVLGAVTSAWRQGRSSRTLMLLVATLVAIAAGIYTANVFSNSMR